MAEWTSIVLNEVKFWILKKDVLSYQYSLVSKPVNNVGVGTSLKYFSAVSDEAARELGYKLANEYNLI